MKISGRVRLLLGVLFLFLFSMCNLPAGNSGPREVSLNADGSGDFDSLQTAIAKLASGSTITLNPGTYYVGESVQLTKGITLKGQPGVTTVTVNAAEYGFLYEKPDETLTLEGIVFQNQEHYSDGCFPS